MENMICNVFRISQAKRWLYGTRFMQTSADESLVFSDCSGKLMDGKMHMSHMQASWMYAWKLLAAIEKRRFVHCWHSGTQGPRWLSWQSRDEASTVTIQEWACWWHTSPKHLDFCARAMVQPEAWHSTSFECMSKPITRRRATTHAGYLRDRWV